MNWLINLFKGIIGSKPKYTQKPDSVDKSKNMSTKRTENHFAGVRKKETAPQAATIKPKLKQPVPQPPKDHIVDVDKKVSKPKPKPSNTAITSGVVRKPIQKEVLGEPDSDPTIERLEQPTAPEDQQNADTAPDASRMNGIYWTDFMKQYNIPDKSRQFVLQNAGDPLTFPQKVWTEYPYHALPDAPLEAYAEHIKEYQAKLDETRRENARRRAERKKKAAKPKPKKQTSPKDITAKASNRDGSWVEYYRDGTNQRFDKDGSKA